MRNSTIGPRAHCTWATCDFDAAWAKSTMPPDDFLALVYDTVR